MLGNEEAGAKSLGVYMATICLCAVFALGISWVYTSTQGIRFLESGYPVWSAKRTMLGACDLGEVAVFGDSRADSAVIPSRLSKQASNLGFAGGTPIEIYFFARSLQSCSKKPKTVLLSFNPGAFEVIQPWLWDNAARYGALGWSEISIIRQEAERLNDRSYFTTKPQIGLDGLMRDVTYSTRFPAIYFNSLIESKVLLRADANRQKFNEVMLSRGYPTYKAGAHVDEGPAKGGDKPFTPLPLQESFFEKTVAMLDRAGIDTFFMITPFNQANPRALNPGYQEAYLALIRRLGSQYPHFHLLQQQAPVWPNIYFADGVHLNEEGADTFSRQLDHCLQELGTPGDPDDRCKFDSIKHALKTANTTVREKPAL